MQRTICWFWLAATAVVVQGATPLGIAFTYQGQLKEAGGSVNGTSDFQFSLWDSAGSGSPPTGGTQVGATQTLNNVMVANGLFTVELNAGGEFGPAAFNGDGRWLQIAVRNPAGSGGVTTLAPRQPLTAAPHASFAANAGLLDGLDSTAFLQSIPVPLTLGGSIDWSAVILGANSSTTGYGVLGYSVAGSGETYGVGGQSDSTGGTGVLGVAGATSGDTRGVQGVAYSPAGRGVFGLSIGTSGFSVGVQGESSASNPTGTGVVGKAQATGGWFEANGDGGTGLFGVATASDGHSFGVQGRSTSWQGTGVYGEATSTWGYTFGGYFVSNSDNGRAIRAEARSLTGANDAVLALNYANGGTAVRGEATAPDGYTYGVYGKVNSPGGNGVYGLAYADTGNASGVVGQSWGSSGSGVVGLASAGSGNNFGVDGSSASTTGMGVRGHTIATTGSTHGVYGRSDSTSGHGVTGWATANSGFTFGVLGESSSPSGNGVRGSNTAITGSGTGVYGKSSGPTGSGVTGFAEATTGTNYGVLGATSSSSGWAIYAQGRLGASGTKSFRIDHPDDPENKYLLHYSTESPEVLNIYSETITLDERGEAEVELPPYFAKINTRPRYQLTAVGMPMPNLHVAEKIDAKTLAAGERTPAGESAPRCVFRIAGGAPSGEVSWEIKAVRNDLWMKSRAASAEIEKTGSERGKYQHPELYGQPPEKGMNYHENRGASPAAPSEASYD